MSETGGGSYLTMATVLIMLLIGTLMAPTVSPSRAQAHVAGVASLDTIQVASNPLEAASLGFAGAVAGGSGVDLARFLAADGIRLQLSGPAHTGISSRQAVASLRELLRGFDRGQTFLSRASPADGSPDRGFAEVLWSARAVGTSDEIHRTFFLGLVRDRGDWRVEEVRLLR